MKRFVKFKFFVILTDEFSPQTAYIQKGNIYKLYMHMNGKIQFWNNILPRLISTIGISYFEK